MRDLEMGGCEMRTGMLVVLVRGGIGAGVGFVLVGCFLRGFQRGWVRSAI